MTELFKLKKLLNKILNENIWWFHALCANSPILILDTWGLWDYED